MNDDQVKIFRLLELTRSQVQYGYVLAEIPKAELSDLAEHHYLVTFFAWQIVRYLGKKKIPLSLERVLEICLVHDLGELFGGDIAMAYAKTNPVAAQAAKKFDKENQLFWASLFPAEEEYYRRLFEEATEPLTNEAIVAKIADYMEVTHYKLYVHRLSKNDVTMVEKRIDQFIERATGEKLKKALNDYVKEWANLLKSNSYSEIFDFAKAK